MAAANVSRDPLRVLGGTIRGALHVRNGCVNQDAIAWVPASGMGRGVALSVADGHGSELSFRSAYGARIAVEVSNEFASELLAASPSGRELSMVKDRLEREVPRRIVLRWRERVDEHLRDSPVVTAEGSAEEATLRAGAPSDPYLTYGSTLATAVVTESFMAFWQIGDGDILALSSDAAADRPVVRGKEVFGNTTSSLCTAEAWNYFQSAVFGTPAPMVLVATDGLANSFSNDDGFRQFASDVMQLVETDGISVVSDQLHGWLAALTDDGSGDDISVGMICRTDRES